MKDTIDTLELLDDVRDLTDGWQIDRFAGLYERETGLPSESDGMWAEDFVEWETDWQMRFIMRSRSGSAEKIAARIDRALRNGHLA